MLSGDVNHTVCRFLSLGKGTSRTLFSLTSQASYQVLLTQPYAVRLHGIDTWIQGTHLENVLDPNWTSTPSGGLKVNFIQN